jgi:aryl-alcohol dehydrogenase
MQCTAALTLEPNAAFSLETINIDPPRANEVLVRIHAVGICHTDLIFASGAMGTSFPAVFGHEGAGVVEAVGNQITKVVPGEKVLLTFRSCGSCARCDAHEPAYCQNFPALNFACVREDGTSALRRNGKSVSGSFFGQSSFASRAIAYERNLIRLSPEADLAALAPLGCSVQTGVGAVTRSLAAKSGSSLIVIGGGAVGQSAILGGVIAGCATIVLIEPRIERRQLGLSLGAHHVLDPAAGDLPTAVRAVLPCGADYILDTSGHMGALQAAITMLGSKGTLGMVGVPGALDSSLQLPVVPTIMSGITVKGIIEGDSAPDDFLPQLIDLNRQGRLPIDRLVTTYPISRINDAVADAHDGRCIKAVLLFDV